MLLIQLLNLQILMTMKIVSYEKEMDPFELFLNELLNNLDSKVEINADLQALGEFLDARYKFIDPKCKRLILQFIALNVNISTLSNFFNQRDGYFSF